MLTKSTKFEKFQIVIHVFEDLHCGCHTSDNNFQGIDCQGECLWKISHPCKVKTVFCKVLIVHFWKTYLPWLAGM